MLILAGNRTPFVLKVSFPGVDLLTEHDTYADARKALEETILDHQDAAHDYMVEDRRVGNDAGPVIKYPITFRGDNDHVGAWSISWLPKGVLS